VGKGFEKGATMKILTKKKVDEILKRIAENDIIAVKSVGDFEAFEKHADNNAEVVFLVGGIRGLSKVKKILERYAKDLLERSNHERSV
jgi:type III secretory pathway component EscV